MILIIKHIEIEGPGTLGEFFNEQTSWQTKIVELGSGQILPSLDECQAIISLGGPMNVYEEDKHHFLKEEDNFLKMAIQKEIPILGICLGAQLLAKACGAKVKRAAQKEIGWHEVSLTDKGKCDPLFEGLSSALHVFEWHEDAFEVPRNGVLLAESKSCTNQAFRFGSNAYGLQFHIEVTPEMIGSWINKYTAEESRDFIDKEMLIESYRGKRIFERQANMIYLNFARVIGASQKNRLA